MNRTLVIGFFVAMALVFAVVAAWTPVQGDAWLHWVWAGRHPDASIGTWVLSHASSADAFGYLLARSPSAHVLVSPMVQIALVVGLFVLAVGRTPTASRMDLLGLALVSALIWIAQPQPGIALFYTPSVAMHVYGAAAAVWLLAPLRCGWKVPAAAWPALVLAGYCAGTSTRGIATFTLISMVWMMRGRAERWSKIALAGLVIGTVVGYTRSPYLELGKVLRRGVDPNLYVLKLPIEEIGRVIALVAVFALVELGRRRFGKTALVDEDQPAGPSSWCLILGYFALSVWSLLGPKYYDATLLASTCVLVVAALPWLLWFARQRGYAVALASFAIAVHAVVWPVALSTYRQVGHEGERRMQILRTAPPASSPTMPPYRQILATPFFFGEDFSTARLRQLVAVEVFGLRDIIIAPMSRRLESNPQVKVKLETDGVTPAQLIAAHAPAIWSTVPSVSREQFELFVKRLRSITAVPVSTRLVVLDPALPQLARPVLLAWVDRDETAFPRVQVSTLDEENQYTVKMTGIDPKQFKEASWLQGDTVTSTPYRNGSPRVRPTLQVRNAIVSCNDTRCLLIDAFVPRF